MTSLHFSAALALCTIVAACSNEQAQRADGVDAQPVSQSVLEVHQLKERVEGLRGSEYNSVRRQVDALRAKLASNPRDVDALGRLAIVFMNEARVTGDHPYYYPAAMTLVDRALTIDSKDYVTLVAKGSILLSLHRFTEALAIGEQAATLFPDNAIVQGILCDAHVELGNYEQAIAAADRMVTIRPDLKSYSRISYIRELHGDIDGAVEAMRMAVEAGPPGSEEKAWTRTTLGTVLATHGREGEATREFQLASIERDRYPFAIVGLARIQHKKGNDELALSMIDSAIALVPEFSFVEFKAEVLRAMGDTVASDSLVGVIETMLAEDEAAGHAMHNELALLYATNNVKLDSALLRAQLELQRRPNNVDAQHTMAFVLLKAGRAADAKPYMEKARRLGGRNPEWAEHARMIDRAVASGRTDASSHVVRVAR